MKRVTYVSRKARGLSEEDIESIQEKSVKNNSKESLGGVLLDIGEHFVQCIEGPAMKVDARLKVIEKDPRHKDMIIIKTEYPISHRVFGDWEMHLVKIEKSETSLFPFETMIKAIIENRSALCAYTQKDVVEQFEKGLNPVHIQPKKLMKTILFADIVGFTKLTEKCDIDTVVSILNLTSSIITQEVQKRGGLVNKLMGDGALVYFEGKKVVEALEASIAIQDIMTEMNQQAPLGDPVGELSLGIGISTGFVIEGNIGSYFKKDYTILGEPVNMASRIEKLTRRVGRNIVFSSDVAEELPESLKESLGTHQVRGSQIKMELFGLKKAELGFMNFDIDGI